MSNEFKFRYSIVKLFGTGKILMEEARPKNVQHNFKAIYYFSRCFGLWPFTIAYNANGSIKEACLCQFDYLWFLISICVYLTALHFTYEHIKTLQFLNEKAFFSHLIYNLIQIPPLLLGVIGSVFDMLNRRRLVNILKKFTIFDEEVRFCYNEKEKFVNRVCECKVHVFI